MTEEFLQWIRSLIDTGCLDRFYKSSQWIHLSRNVAKHQKYICQYCKKAGIIKKYRVIHHIHHVKDKPELALSEYDYDGKINLIALCDECHYAEHHPRIGFTNVERW